jgi:hypothetical protein
MSKNITKDTLEFMDKAHLIFMINFEDNTQNIVVGNNAVSIGDLLTSPFRLSLHLNQLLEDKLKNEGQTGETLEEAPKEDN